VKRLIAMLAALIGVAPNAVQATSTLGDIELTTDQSLKILEVPNLEFNDAQLSRVLDPIPVKADAKPGGSEGDLVVQDNRQGVVSGWHVDAQLVSFTNVATGHQLENVECVVHFADGSTSIPLDETPNMVWDMEYPAGSSGGGVFIMDPRDHSNHVIIPMQRSEIAPGDYQAIIHWTLHDTPASEVVGGEHVPV